MSIESSKISPFLWFKDNAEEAADYYVSIFPNSSKGKGLNGPDGKAITVPFVLEGLPFTALNGNPEPTFNKSVSFFVRCKDQAEIDYFWNRLTADGGKEIQCGWLEDKFGLAWQIVPENIMHLISPPKAFQAMIRMKKLNIAELEAAARE